MTLLTLYGKAGCCLCDDARTAVETVAAERDLGVAQVDIASDPVLFRRYRERIPVLAADGEELLELAFDAAAIRAALAEVAG